MDDLHIRRTKESNMYRAAARSWSWLSVLARLLVGGVWLLAGALKLADPAVSVRAVRAYQLLPESIVPATGRGLPVLEICVGPLLLAGLATRVAAALSAVLLVAFIVGISAAWARGLQID
ncbi:MAG: MauE/DoxX family redox-associated membrane protein [Nocardioidaceae bacterium]